MATTRKKITADKLIELYIDEILTTETEPKSVYAFAKNHKFDEQMFYEYFNSFEALEKGVFEKMASDTIQLLEKNEEYQAYSSRNKLLSFYFTLFEMFTANRSYLRLRLKEKSNKLESLKLLGGLKNVFTEYIVSLELQDTDLRNDSLNNLRDKGITQGAWVQLLMTIQFWLEDNSPKFEKTDAFIEKSINASFDLIDVTPVKSIIDFAKFVWKEKINL